jgi:ATP-dependent DNA helicase DinG
MNITQKDWERYFPFQIPRKEQIDAINFILEQFINNKKRITILDAGVGIGKSAIGVTVARFLQNHRSSTLNYKLGAWYLTTQKILQEQYLSDFGGKNHISMKSIKSSTSYVCCLHENDPEPKLSCGEIHRLMRANEIFKTIYKHCTTECKYRKDKHIFLEALNSVTNYAYFMSESQYAGHIQPRELLICDEAHTCAASLSNHVEISISERFANYQLDLKMPDSFQSVSDAFNWVRTKYLTSLKFKVAEVAKQLENVCDASKKIKSFQDFAKRHDLLDKHMCKVNRLIKLFTQDNWVLNIVPPFGKSLRKLEFKPVDVSPFVEDHLFSFGNNILLMSATILDKNTFCKTLGIDKDSVAYINIPSPFAIENRPIHIMPVGSMSKSRIDTTLPIMVQAVKTIIDQHKEDKGIIHCVNFKIAKYLIENIGDHRLITHDSTNRNLILKLHAECKKPSILVSPSMMEGVDLKDDQSRFQILCKLPYPYLGDVVVQKRMKLDPNWYQYSTLMLLIQAMGRSIRNENDYAISYILDSDWNKFYHMTKHMIPKDFINCLHM